VKTQSVDDMKVYSPALKRMRVLPEPCATLQTHWKKATTTIPTPILPRGVLRDMASYSTLGEPQVYFAPGVHSTPLSFRHVGRVAVGALLASYYNLPVGRASTEVLFRFPLALLYG